MEGYLANKWGITHQLPADHANRYFMSGIGSGISAEITAASPTQAYPIPVTVTFKKGGSNHAVSDFASDFTTSFKPTEVNGLELWLDAADTNSITHSSNSISRWADKSGNGNDATQGTASNQPTITSSGIQFDGSNDGFNLGNDISEANLNIFFVLHGHGFLYANNGTERTLFYDAGSGRKLWVRINGNEFFSQRSVSGYSDSTTQIHEFSLNSGTFTVRVNGVEALSQASVSGNMKLDRIGLKWDSNTGVSTWAGKLKEIIAATTTTNRSKVEGYLAHKWGLTSSLPSNHAYKTSQPTSTGVSSNDFVVRGASVSNVSGSGATYTMNLTPHSNPARIKIKVGEGAAQSSATGERNQRSSKEILFRPSVMKESNLAMYFPLDEPENATTVQDWGPHGLVGTVSGNPPRYPGRVGSAFRFPQGCWDWELVCRITVQCG